MDFKKTKNEYVRWLLRYDWQWFCTLTIRPGIRQWAAAQLYREWINRVEKDHRNKISWVRIIERGDEGRLHVHALLAGTRRHFDPQDAERLWLRLAGDALIGRYDPDSLCLQYSLKSIEDGPNYDIDFALSGKHFLKPEQLRRIEDDMEWLTWITRSRSNS